MSMVAKKATKQHEMSALCRRDGGLCLGPDSRVPDAATPIFFMSMWKWLRPAMKMSPIQLPALHFRNLTLLFYEPAIQRAPIAMSSREQRRFLGRERQS